MKIRFKERIGEESKNIDNRYLHATVTNPNCTVGQEAMELNSRSASEARFTGSSRLKSRNRELSDRLSKGRGTIGRRRKRITREAVAGIRIPGARATMSVSKANDT